MCEINSLLNMSPYSVYTKCGLLYCVQLSERQCAVDHSTRLGSNQTTVIVIKHLFSNVCHFWAAQHWIYLILSI